LHAEPQRHVEAPPRPTPVHRNPRLRARRLLLGLGLLIAVLAAPPRVIAAPRASSPAGVENQQEEYRFKAAYLYNFLGYTTWPKGAFDSEEGPIELLIVGKDPFGRLIDDTFEDKRIGKRSVRIERARALPEDCAAHVVFVAGLDVKERKALLTALAKKPVLVIGEAPGFAEAGATINFYLEDAKLRFEINTDATKANGLTLSSQLLKLAKIVKTKEEQS
jgi:hypothetical protein